jgi:hypothetical protein
MVQCLEADALMPKRTELNAGAPRRRGSMRRDAATTAGKTAPHAPTA